MNNIIKMVEALLSDKSAANRKSPLKNLGFVSCANTIHIKHVPFYDPCLILVLSGRKVLFEDQKPVYCEAGKIIAVPAPSSFDLRNEPDPRTKKYNAIIIPFKLDVLERLGRMHTLVHEVQRDPVGILKFDPDDTLYTSIEHYLTTLDNPKLLNHRLMEILLILVSNNTALLSYDLHRNSWSQRVRAVVAADLAQVWEISEVCSRLATTESTLRRNLKREDTSFRELLYELRLSSALMQLLQTTLPVYRVAYDCGYQSVSRFTSNFRKRFGVPPTQFRTSLSESERTLAV